MLFCAPAVICLYWTFPSTTVQWSQVGYYIQTATLTCVHGGDMWESHFLLLGRVKCRVHMHVWVRGEVCFNGNNTTSSISDVVAL